MFEDEIPIGRAKDLRGKTFGQWTVLYRTKNVGKHTMWKCRCTCGKERSVSACHLVTGASQSCGGCSRLIDLTGRKFGRLVALKPTSERSGSSVSWLCVCDCGNNTIVSSQSLLRGDTQSCGCLLKERRCDTKVHDLTGKRFGRLVALYPISASKENEVKQRKWHCQCDCGQTTDVNTRALLLGDTISCGCYSREQAAKVNFNKAIDLTGQIFGKWKVLKRDPICHGTGAYWICQCECGTVRTVAANSLVAGTSYSCGCESMSRGERAIISILNNNNIFYEFQKSFPTCKFPDTNYPARFDFFC